MGHDTPLLNTNQNLCTKKLNNERNDDLTVPLVIKFNHVFKYWKNHFADLGTSCFSLFQDYHQQTLLLLLHRPVNAT